MPKERFKVIPAVHVLFVKDSKVLLLRRFQTGWMDGSYSVPAGHVDGDESAAQAATREAKEEVGVTLENKDLRLATVMHRRTPEGKENERLDFFFVATKWTGEIENKEPNKCDDLGWFSISDLPQNVVPYVRFGIEAYHKGLSYSEFGW